MSENKINRRDVCKTLLAFGSLTLGSLATKGQTPTPTPSPLTDVLQDQKLADAVKRGATMEEISKLRDPIANNPQEALRALKTGSSPISSPLALVVTVTLLNWTMLLTLKRLTNSPKTSSL